MKHEGSQKKTSHAQKRISSQSPEFVLRVCPWHWCDYPQNVSWRTNVESRPLSRTMFWQPEGHDLGSSEGDKCFVSQGCKGSLGETNGDMNFASSNRFWLGRCFTLGISGWVAEAVFPNFSSWLPCMDRFFLKKLLEWVSYQKFKIEDGIDMEV